MYLKTGVQTMHKSRPPCRIVGGNVWLILFSIILVQIYILVKHINKSYIEMDIVKGLFIIGIMVSEHEILLHSRSKIIEIQNISIF